ncbi:MAG: DUF3450 domain-containing protein [Deltaproteobacteria bacterium]|nr:DUF3450 domain-containing protein [Deltaproteobacteria bacterium]
MGSIGMHHVAKWATGVICLVCVGLAYPSAAGQSPSGVKKTAEKTVATDVKTQKAVDAWAVEEKRLLEKIDEQERALRRVTWEQNKTAQYLRTLEQKVKELREKAREMEKINAKLLPILDQGLEKLITRVKTDIPFDQTRRLKRMEDTAHTLNDYDVGLLAKTRALFDAMAGEVDFGYSVDSKETEVDIQGRSTRVKLLKVGRAGLYALSMDGEKAYVWNPRENAYLPVEGSVRDIDEAVEIVERIRIIELTKLPMGRPGAGPRMGGGPHE